MIIKRIAEGIKNQDWFVVMVEVLVVVVGIFIGLQVTEWNENRKAKGITQSYYNRLLTDLQAEEMMREARIKYIRSVLWHGEAVLEYLNKLEDELSPKFIHHLYQASQIWPYAPQRTTYDEVLSGNIASLIPDENLRARLGFYYVSMKGQMDIQNERTPYRGAIRGNLPHEVQSYIRENCGELNLPMPEQGMQLTGVVLFKECEMNLDAALIEAAYKGLIAYPDLKKDLNRHLADMEQKISSMRGFDSRTTRLRLIAGTSGEVSMTLRRFTKHITDQNWFAVGLFAVVF